MTHDSKVSFFRARLSMIFHPIFANSFASRPPTCTSLSATPRHRPPPAGPPPAQHGIQEALDVAVQHVVEVAL